MLDIGCWMMEERERLEEREGEEELDELQNAKCKMKIVPQGLLRRKIEDNGLLPEYCLPDP